MSGYQKNIWSNPFQAVDECQSHLQSDLSYLQRLQAHQFPHIVPNLKSLEELESSEKMEIYENPSEHYAAIKYGESNVSKVGGVQSLEPLSAGSSSNSNSHNSAFGNQLLQARNSRTGQHQQTPGLVNFYGYGRSDGFLSRLSSFIKLHIYHWRFQQPQTKTMKYFVSEILYLT